MKKNFLSVTFFCFLILFLLPYSFALEKGNFPPISPSWVFDHWVWEDDENNEKAIWEMIDGYEKYDIPVGAIIIDSPWAGEYNNFIFDLTKYPNPKELIEKLHKKGIKVILWVTVMLNEENPSDDNEPKTNEIYKEAKEKGYLINNGEAFKWWKGKGAYMDFTNPESIEWWHRLQDRVLDLGIDGWKVDEVSMTFPSVGQGKYKKISRLKYKDAYYMDFYEYAISKNPKNAAMVRSVDVLPFCPISHSAVTWVGDQNHNWGKDGFLEALSHIFNAANFGYAVIGSDTAGYHGDEEITKQLLIRWAQFSAFCTFFENGGHGKHEPWLFDKETIDIYKYYVKLHLELKPYFYSLMMKSHLKEGNVFTAYKDTWQLQIGNYILISVIYEDKNIRKVFLPDGNWIDYWSGEIRKGPCQFDYEVPLSKYPIFLREGSIIPLEVIDDTCGQGGVWSKDADTFLIVPGIDSSFTLYGEGRNPALIKMQCTPSKISISCEKTEKLKIFLLKNIQGIKEVKGNGLIYKKIKKIEEFTNKDFSFYYDKLRKVLFIKSNEVNALDLQVLLK